MRDAYMMASTNARTNIDGSTPTLPRAAPRAQSYIFIFFLVGLRSFEHLGQSNIFHVFFPSD